MNIWIMRHGEASFSASSDSERTLTPFGIEMAKKQGQWLGNRLNQAKIQLDKILVSPYLRTQQTLEAVKLGLQAVGFSQSFTNLVETWEEITPDGNQSLVLDYLDFLRDEGAKNVLLISHLPLVFDLVCALTDDQSQVHFYPAVMAELCWQGNIARLTHTEIPRN